jgi:hypothetical protein
MGEKQQPETITHVVIYSGTPTLDIEHFSETIIGEYDNWLYQRKARDLQHIHKADMTIAVFRYRATLWQQENIPVLLDFSI